MGEFDVFYLFNPGCFTHRFAASVLLSPKEKEAYRQNMPLVYAR